MKLYPHKSPIKINQSIHEWIMLPEGNITRREYFHIYVFWSGSAVKSVRLRSLFLKKNPRLLKTSHGFLTKWGMVEQCNYNPFLSNVLILQPLKTSENIWFNGVFRGYRIGALARNNVVWITAQRMKFSITDFFSNWIWSHLLKYLMGNFIFETSFFVQWTRLYGIHEISFLITESKLISNGKKSAVFQKATQFP